MPEFMTIYTDSSIAEGCWKLFHVMLGLAATAPIQLAINTSHPNGSVYITIVFSSTLNV